VSVGKALNPRGADRRGFFQSARPPAQRIPAPTAYNLGRERYQFRRVFANLIGRACGPTGVAMQVAAGGPTELLQALQERRDARLLCRMSTGRSPPEKNIGCIS
jgi:hypothetical protein